MDIETQAPTERHSNHWKHTPRFPRCPHCLSSALDGGPVGTLVCAACCRTVPAPPRSSVLASWELDPRLADDWDRYSRTTPGHADDHRPWPGPLVTMWGSSTAREDGKAPPADGEDRAPRVVRQAKRGSVDDLLDGLVREYVAGTEALVDVAHRLEALARLENGTAPPAKSSRPSVVAGRRARGASAIRQVLLDHTAEATGEAPAPTGSTRAHEIPWWHQHVALASLGLLAGLYEVVTNAIKDRGVEWMGSLDRVAPRTERVEPFANVRHAVDVAFSTTGAAQLGGGSPRLGGAMAKHALPQGLVFGAMAVHPTRNGSEHAPGEDAVIERVDLLKAIGAARVGRVVDDKGNVTDEGRSLDATDLELLGLVDHGREHVTAKRGKNGITLAIEPMRADDAAEALRASGTAITGRQAKLRIAGAREGLERALRARDYIPEPKAKTKTKKKRTRVTEGRPSFVMGPAQ